MRLSAVKQLQFRRHQSSLVGRLLSLGLDSDEALAVSHNAVTAFYLLEGQYKTPSQLIESLSLEEIANICETAKGWDEYGGSIGLGNILVKISTVIARHKSIFHTSPPLQLEVGTMKVEVPVVKEIPSISLPKPDKLLPKTLPAVKESFKDFRTIKAFTYPIIESTVKLPPSSSYEEEGMLHYLRRERTYLPQNMEVDVYN